MEGSGECGENDLMKHYMEGEILRGSGVCQPKLSNQGNHQA